MHTDQPAQHLPTWAEPQVEPGPAKNGSTRPQMSAEKGPPASVCERPDPPPGCPGVKPPPKQTPLGAEWGLAVGAVLLGAYYLSPELDSVSDYSLPWS
jgi:hypothetical protein